MNQFGKNLRLSVFGESHGEMIGITIDGVPPGIELSTSDFTEDIARRKPGQKGTTPRVESDQIQIVSGQFNGFTTGAPLTFLFANENKKSKDYEAFKNQPRPGHADFVADKKYKGFQDFRGGGHFSGRLTLLLVAAGVVAKKIISPVIIRAELIEIAGEKDLELGLQKAIDVNDSVGGLIETTILNVPIGLGDPFFNSVESVLSHAMFAIPAVKGIEFGSGFEAAKMFGSKHNDAILNENGRTKTNHSGGINGGISNGNDIVFRLAIKPASSTPVKQESWNTASKQLETFSIEGRHDLCIALRAPVVVEAMAALVMADFYLEK